MNARDELARDIFLADNVNAPTGLMEAEWDGNKGDETYAHMIADGLLAAGYSKPRTITSYEELEALPAGSVVRDDSGRLWEWEHVGFGGVEKALSAMGIGAMLAPISFRQFPATVLFEGEAK